MKLKTLIFCENLVLGSEMAKGNQRTAKNTHSVIYVLRKKLLLISVSSAFVSYSWTKDAIPIHSCDKNIVQMH